MKVSKGQSQPEIAAAAFLILYMVLGRPFEYRVLIVTQIKAVQVPLSKTGRMAWRGLCLIVCRQLYRES